MPQDSPFDAFKTDLKLAILTLKEELHHDLERAADSVLVEVRERLGRTESERNAFYGKMEVKMDTLEDLARSTNGQVTRHRDVLFGTGNGDGLIEEVKNGTQWRKGLVTAGGVWLAVLWLIWMAYGDAVKERGIINRPVDDYVGFIDGRIQQWLPEKERPTQPPPPLAPLKK